MTTCKQNLTALRDDMVAGSWYGDTTEFFTHKCHIDCFNAFEGDMNAALAFVAAVLPGWGWRIQDMRHGGRPWALVVFADSLHEAAASTPALALTIAALNALIELEDVK